MKNKLTTDALTLDILTSLARSQRAMAKLLESASGYAEMSDRCAEAIAGNMELIARYQRILTLRIRAAMPLRKSQSEPARPWINRQKNVFIMKP